MAEIDAIAEALCQAPPPPLTSAEVDLRDFPFMPLEVRRLLSSETWIEAADDPRLAHALVSLWCESWHQVPPGSLPDKDAILAHYARCERQEWERIRQRALQGWVLCSDGRFYHPVIAQKARESWARKCQQREKTRRATETREQRRADFDQQRDVQRDVRRDEVRDVSRHVERDVHQERGREIGTGIKGGGADAPTSSPEEIFWSRLDDLEAKGISRSQATKLLKLVGGDLAEANRALDAAAAAGQPAQYLGGVFRNLEGRGAGRVSPVTRPGEQAWVHERRAAGVPVEREGQHWRSAGELLDDAGDVVGW